jgi:GNAT superfamily N-acetyltransferase
MLDDVIIRPLRADELDEAQRICRVAFGTFVGFPDPDTFMAGQDFVGTRWRADPASAFAAEIDGRLVGSNLATRWGSVGFFGPLTVRPECWNAGVGQRLLEPVMRCFAEWKLTHAGLFTFAQSPKHVGLYGKYGFWPRFLTQVMAKPVGAEAAASAPDARVSSCAPDGLDGLLAECRAVTDAVYAGLDVAVDIRAVADQGLGDTVLVRDRSGTLVALAVCHCGPDTEAGPGVCYLKFAAVRPGAEAGAHFRTLLAACEALAHERGLATLMAGVNLAREEAARALVAAGFRPTPIQGVALHRPNAPGYSRPGLYVLDDWR